MDSPLQLHVPCRQGDRMLKNVIRAMEARLPFSSDSAVTVRGYGSVGEGADCPKGALNRRLVQDAIAVTARSAAENEHAAESRSRHDRPEMLNVGWFCAPYAKKHRAVNYMS